MAKRIDLTGKLGIGEKPRIVVAEGVELEVDDSAPTVLRVIELVGDGTDLASAIEACRLFFGKKGMSALESLKMPPMGYAELLNAAVELVMGGGSGNAETPATT